MVRTHPVAAALLSVSTLLTCANATGTADPTPCNGGPFDAGRLTGTWRATTVASGEAQTDHYLVLNACGAELYTFDLRGRSASTFAGYAMGDRRLWVGVDGGTPLMDHEYFANADQLALNPYWPEGAHREYVGRWVRPSDAGATLAASYAELVIEADGGGRLLVDGQVLSGGFVPGPAEVASLVLDGGSSCSIQPFRDEANGIAALSVSLTTYATPPPSTFTRRR